MLSAARPRADCCMVISTPEREGVQGADFTLASVRNLEDDSLSVYRLLDRLAMQCYANPMQSGSRVRATGPCGSSDNALEVTVRF